MHTDVTSDMAGDASASTTTNSTDPALPSVPAFAMNAASASGSAQPVHLANIGAGLRSGLLRNLTRRERRVFLLIFGIILLSLADLWLTIHYLTTMGMMEANPIAVWVIKRFGSPWALSAFKLASVAASCWLLYLVRHHRIGELAAWACSTILAFMCYMWFEYTEELNQPSSLQLVQMAEGGGDWLRFD